MSYKKTQIELNEEQKNGLKTLIANLVGPKNRLNEMQHFRITYDMLPETMKFERDVLRLIEACAAQGVPPTRENIISRLVLEDEDAEKRLDILLNYQTEQKAILPLAFALSDWMTQAKVKAGLLKAMNIATSPHGSMNDKWAEIMKTINEVAPRTHKTDSVSIIDGIDIWQKQQDEKIKRIKEGKDVGPNFPWQNLNKLIPGLRPGEMTTIDAKTKHGKTSLAMYCMYHQAYHKSQGYYVLALFLETTPESIMSRVMSRELCIPVGVWKAGGYYDENKKFVLVDHRQEPLKTKISDVKARMIKEQKESGGHLEHVYVSGIDVYELKSIISRHKAIAANMGLEMIVWVDYYQILDSSRFASTETEGYNKAAEFIKTQIANDLNIHVVLLAQFGVDQDYNKSAPYGGSRVLMRAQNHIRLIRKDDAESDERWMIGKKQKTDAIGNPMYWHRKGQVESLSQIKVMHSNDDSPGSCFVRFVNGYFMILPVEKVPLDDFANQGLVTNSNFPF